MYDTHITIVGTILNKPEKRVVEKTGAVVASFRVISHSRRFDKETETWADGPHFRSKVNCWRRLADHVLQSVQPGDPVVIYGRITTREWQNEQGEPRVMYEVDADNIGHDMSRGVSHFQRTRFEGPQSVIEDDEADARINGEVAHLFDPSVDEHYPDGYDESYTSSVFSDTTDDAQAILRDAGLDGSSDAAGGEDDEDEEELVGAAGSGGSGGRRRRGR
jgi:single-strand DNA-binding protein